MIKKQICVFLAAIMLISSFSIVFAEELGGESVTEAQTVSADGGLYNSVDMPNAESLMTSGTENMAGTMGRQAFDGTVSDGTLDVAEGINTNIVENSSKYNSMASVPLPETPSPSRYSTSRIKLSPDITGTPYEEAAELLGALGIMVGDAETGAFRPNDSIIRSEMAKVAVYSVGLEDIAKGSMGRTRFPDVAKDHWATGAINVADQQGMVIGDAEGTFRPDDKVLLQEAITIMVRAMGYEPAAQERGGYPTGYLYIASNNQLLRGITGNAGEPATRGDVAQLVFNSLTVNLMEQTGYGNNVSYEVVDKNLLYDRLNVEKGYGQITGTGETSLTGDSVVDEDRILIGDKQFELGDSNAKQLLGYNVLYYARLDKTSDEKTLILVRSQENKNRVVTVNSDDIVSITGDTGVDKSFEYWASENDRRTKTATISKDASYIYNGKFKASVDNTALKPTSGNVTLLDSDINGTYEVVFVNHFTNLVVDTISTVTGRVTDKYLNGSLVLDENQENVQYSLIKNGAEIGIDELKEWNVISYTISDDRELIRGYVSDNSITGVVTEVTDEGYRIGNSTEVYKKAASYPSDIVIRDKGTFYLDIEGKIAAVDPNAQVDDSITATQKYGYLIGAAMNDAFEETLRLRIYTMSGETKVFDATSRIRLGNRYGLEPDEVLAELKGGDGVVSPQLIVYEVNSTDNVNAIELANDNTGTGAPQVGKFTLNIAKEGMVYKSATSKLDNVTIADSTVIFDIPAGAGTDTEKYSVRGKGTLSNDTSYDAMVYDLEENYVAGAVIITSSEGVTAPESPILVVESIAATQNEDYEDTDRVYGWQNGEKVNIIAEDKSILRKGTDGEDALEKGDIIQYRTNSNGEIDGVNLLFDSNLKTTEFTREVTTDLTTVYGRVTKKFSGSINMTVNGEIRNYATGGARVYLFDSTRPKADIQVVSPADIEIFEEGNEARLFIKIYDDVVEEMVIVR